MLRENEVSHQLKTRYYSSLPRAAKHPQLRFERWQWPSQLVTWEERDLHHSPNPPHSTQFLLKLAWLEKGHRLSTCATLLLQQGVRLGAWLLPWIKMLEKTTSLKQFNTGQKRHILICTAMHLGYKFTQHNWKKKIQTMLLYLFHGVSLIPSHLPFSASLNAAIYTHKQTIKSWMFI